MTEVLAVIFVMIGIGYVASHGLRGNSWASAPVLFSLAGIAQFALIPEALFLSRAERGDGYALAMQLALTGFVAFWVGASIVRRPVALSFVPDQPTRPRVALAAAVLCMIGFVSQYVEWRLGLLSYLADETTYAASLGYAQILSAGGKCLLAALAVASIEKFGKPRCDRLIHLSFWFSLVASIGFGVISGMKGQILTPILLVVVIMAIIQSRIPRLAFAMPLLLALIYPFVNAYRINLNSGYKAQINTMGGLEDTFAKTVSDVITNSSEELATDADHTGSRLSKLDFVRDVITLPAPELLNGSETIWLAPVYPLIPRYLWPDKPIFDKGNRLSEILGRGKRTSSAMTPIADLWVMYGTAGLVIGMLLYGAGMQVFMNTFARAPLNERRLFVYLAILSTLMGFELDAIALIGVIVQSVILAFVAGRVIYG